MHTRKIPRSGEEIPVIGLGTWNVKLTATLFRRFASCGGRLIDTSPMYGKAEQTIGELISNVERPWIATKVWTQGREAGIEQMQRSMRLLRQTQIDLIQVHNLVDWQVHLQTLRNWKAAEKVRYIGITHYQTGAFPQLAQIMEREAIDFVQLPLSIELPDAEQRLLPLALDRGIAVIVNRPFEEGALMRRVRNKAVPAGFGSWSELFLRYIVSHPAVTCVIPATSSVSHLEENMRAGEASMLSKRERAELRKFVR